MPTNATLMPLPKQQFLSSVGSPLVGGKVYTYAAGTNNLKATFTDAAATTPQENPIPLNARGEPNSQIYWNGAYKVELRDALGNVIYTVDNYVDTMSTISAAISAVLSVLQLADFAALRAYKGDQTGAYVTGFLATAAPSGIAGAFVVDASDATSADNGGTTIVDTLGRRWKRPFAGAVRAAWFGAKFNGVADDRAPIQNAIDYAIYTASPPIGEVQLDSGWASTSDTIHIGYGTDFRELTLTGAGSSCTGAAPFGGTTIRPTFSDRPALVVQGGRRVCIRRLALLGKNASYIINNKLGAQDCAVDDTALTAWVDPALNANANSRYAPYAGIAVDPYVGAAPAPSYPAVNYPAFLGANVPQYGKARTDTVSVEDCYISGFVVGTVIQPCNDDGNGDFVTFTRTTYEFNAYGISVGNAQSRNVNMDTVGFRNVHTCLTNNKHGKATGKFGGSFRGCHADRISQIFDLDGGMCGPLVFDGWYGELIWRIGVQATPTRNYPITFIGGELNMSGHPAIRGVPAKIASGVITMAGTSLNLPSMACADGVKFSNGAKIETYDTTLAVPSAARLLAQKATCGVMPMAAALSLDPTDDLTYVVDAGGLRRAVQMSNSLGRGTPFNRVARWMRFGDNSSAVPALPVPFGWAGVKAKASIPANIVGISGTLDFTELYAAIFQFGISAGDVIQDDQTGTLFLVNSMAGPVASVTALNNYYNPGTGNAFRVAVSTNAGNWYVYSSRIYGTTYPNYGTIAAGSAIITNVGRADTYAGYLNADLAVGDFIWQNDWFTKYFPAGAKITAFDTAARTITMSAAATKAGTDIPLNLWVRA